MASLPKGYLGDLIARLDSEVDSASRRKPAVSIARAAASLATHPLFIAVVIRAPSQRQI